MEDSVCEKKGTDVRERNITYFSLLVFEIFLQLGFSLPSFQSQASENRKTANQINRNSMI